ncbi:MAG TPA: glycosyltransferase [Candidatus Binataceae bacterium]|nr:glycosyltransferase [Candidatus Binataceae bacterium]
MSAGLSVIICTHNGETRLPATLAHLKAQPPSLAPWEVVLIDNASTDDTAKVGLSCWSKELAPLRIVHEPRLGLQIARERGLREAKYDVLGFIDDDNWVSPDWVHVANEVFTEDHSLGAVGSISEPVFEGTEPDWFSASHSIYAILTDSDYDHSHEMPGFLPGAGLCIRKEAWLQLIRGGFCSRISDRVGSRLSGGGDTELTMAIRLAGWKIRVEPRLRLKHFMPASRLRWEYLRRLERGYAASNVLLDAYSIHNLCMRSGLRFCIGQQWWCQIGRLLVGMLLLRKAVFAAITSKGESRQDVLEVERLYGRILGMLRVRNGYRASRHAVRYAAWRLRRPEEYLKRLRRVHQ